MQSRCPHGENSIRFNGAVAKDGWGESVDLGGRRLEAYALPDARAETVAKKLVEEFICRYGIPLEIHSDQGSNFESHLFAEMCRLLGITKTRTTPYNPKSDGMIERFNRTLINMIAIWLRRTTNTEPGINTWPMQRVPTGLPRMRQQLVKPPPWCWGGNADYL